MKKVTTICYLSSVLFYGMGFLKVRVINNTVTEPLTTYDYTVLVSLATAYFVLAIFFAIVGSLFFYVRKYRSQRIITLRELEFQVKVGKEFDKRRTCVPQLKNQYKRPAYNPDLYRRMSS